MPRRLRHFPVGVPQHIIQRGNNRQICFAADQDFAAYAFWLLEYSQLYQVEIHAWVFMTNHVHLLCTPKTSTGVSTMMQSLGRMYVRYFNKSYQRTGTLWEGRYKSCLVDAEGYLLHLHRYIELNPVRAAMVGDPADYKWSSYQANGLGEVVKLCSSHEIYMALGATGENRRKSYRALFEGHVDEPLLTDIRLAANKSLVLGNHVFIAQMEALTGRCYREGKRGRPKLDAKS